MSELIDKGLIKFLRGGLYILEFPPESGAEYFIYKIADSYVNTLKFTAEHEVMMTEENAEIVPSLESARGDVIVVDIDDHSDPVEFARNLWEFAQSKGVAVVIAVPRGIIPEDVLSKLEFIADGVIKIEIERRVESIILKFSMPKNIGSTPILSFVRFRTNLNRFEIDSRRDIV